ncbi:Homogentisate 1,2-dioxygenase [Fulvia fulva]|uniref:homogentisate 1,2-dioxygenase n=1 Tax=Passalora fulva TaxID=5499 RepID=A0A9Q8UQQ0_PASFU|nr:Homogentisate 1,2-dioxygenase [Fulvia fulva]KAK4621312.1 Homogentisate 1,2-dioxygenase [Fulvia fulva]KAK4622700.1 Homogentisate 1,2-dioxygenase [Fulvia fulva]UJO18953.1 Homogentisate 1,2-dioxygenase [Fulvia fulva]WPV16640.1 Homogentisate 1,2-dioxygenase [Fulvia fulva]WPV31069.1 Homogentisate 1,2-dioxygenase [Fulvia fulva]
MPVTKFKTPEKYRYHEGFGSYHQSEAIKGALPVAQNTPQRPPYGLYTEKITGSSFTAPRGEIHQTWLYRMIPACAHSPFLPEDQQSTEKRLADQRLSHTPTQLRWSPFDLDDSEAVDWPNAMRLLAGGGDPASRTGVGYSIFTAGKSMDPTTAYYSCDGELLIIPQHGMLDIRTELGCLLVRPHEICVIPRGIRYNVALPQGPVRGYAIEMYQCHFILPNLGPLGSFGLANSRDFQVPVASFVQNTTQEHKLVAKFNNGLYTATQDHSPFDIVGWHGLYYPYKYDLGHFMTVGSISHDHPDPSIFTLLASTEGVVEMAIFPPRWLVMENTFRPPWYHRNTVSEFMGLISGEYDARTDGGFRPGGASLHNVMAGHGPDSNTHQKASVQELVPQYIGEGSLAFVIETPVLLGVTDWGMKSSKMQLQYYAETWGGLKSHFQPPEGAEVVSNAAPDAGRVNGTNVVH